MFIGFDLVATERRTWSASRSSRKSGHEPGSPGTSPSSNTECRARGYARAPCGENHQIDGHLPGPASQAHEASIRSRAMQQARSSRRRSAPGVNDPADRRNIELAACAERAHQVKQQQRFVIDSCGIGGADTCKPRTVRAAPGRCFCSTPWPSPPPEEQRVVGSRCPPRPSGAASPRPPWSAALRKAGLHSERARVDASASSVESGYSGHCLYGRIDAAGWRVGREPSRSQNGAWTIQRTALLGGKHQGIAESSTSARRLAACARPSTWRSFSRGAWSAASLAGASR